ncbi:hypothetical protein [Rathayibacter rathayi]|uniref:hypothetical protein n=1 Tax=Rathayibacter rathayi TaxID=33887 RepID=UPI000CE7C731|nr:hypothetical protein [Rathayibacter rathayi]PPF74089.1 hypothetical protein C5C14_15540 [Rathayibacter rathayi]PPG38440.1 hypothetical protein C5C20_13315 [Rathayibacter rathayi]PPG85859.1 hypothetical protein C5C47_12950 [Rathayibacter rathayi]PPG92144.1 hypothetical protein C5C00_14540 [Rathayibacter rathayi]PPH97708.1 hypothetical protein C5C43_13155 [Rathayibacter rathayi]
MTNNSFDKFRDVGSPLSDWTIPAEDGVHRRTIVKGAAWTIPVVAVSVATPAAAASKTPTLKFTQSSYSGTACGTITGVQVKRTTDGTAADAGKTVTVTLADGYKFKDKTTTYTATTDSSGLITLPDISVPARGGDTKFSASSDTLSASAPVTTATKSDAAYVASKNTPGSAYTKVPGDATPLEGNYFLAKNGDLYHGDTLVTSGVSKAVGYNTGGGAANDYVTYITSDGKAHTGNNNSTGGAKTNVPNNSTPLGGNYFLSSDGKLYHGDTLVTSGVSKAVGYSAGGTNDYVNYITSDGKAHTGNNNNTGTAKTNVPNNSTPLGGNYFLSSDGKLYHDDTLVTSGVSKAVGYNSGGGAANDYVTYITSDGKAHTGNNSNTGTAKTNVPKNSTPLSGNYFLSSDGTLYHDDTAVTTDVTAAAGYNAGGTSDYATYTKAKAC